MSAAASLAGRIDAVVIGASAGGVEALSALIPALPAGAEVAVFIVLHLPRDRPSVLAEIFDPKSALRVAEAMDKEPVQAGRVYFAPPDYHLLVDKGPALCLSADDLVNFSRPSIDVLFESAVDVYGERLLGIILTGANEDGAAGLAAIHRAGGITVVQNPETAVATHMVLSAMQRCRPHFVLGLAEIAQLLGTVSHAQNRKGAL